MAKITYKSAGVDIDKANALVADYRRFADSTRTKGALGGIGGFGGFFRPDFRRFKDPILVSSTDGVGTKLKIAFLVDRHDTVGIDLVAMSANDILCSGAEGLFFLDYISTSSIKPYVLKEIIKGIAKGCKDAGYTLVGGETAEMPGMYRCDEYDLAGFGVGIVERKDIIDGRSVKRGDIVLGIESSGLHSNGYSLVRKVLTGKELKKYSDELLTPTYLYSSAVLAVKAKVRIKAIANITGGAFYDKIPRIIPDGMSVDIDKGSWPVPWIFSLVKERARADDRTMYRTFNMGIGMVLVIRPEDVHPAQAILKSHGFKSYLIGEAVKGEGKVNLYG